MLLAFALILNVNASSAATVNNTSSINSNVKTDMSSSMTQISTVSASASKSSTISNSKVTTTAYAVKKTDNTKPKIKAIDPANKAVNVKTTKTIKITFNEKIKAGTKWIEFKNSNGSKISFRTIIRENILYIDPIKSLSNGITYSLIIHTGSITDTSGNKLSLQRTKFEVAKKPISAALVKYLKPTANCQSTNSKIKSLAASITKGKTSQLSKASAIFNWVRNNISYSFYYNTRKGALGTLSSRSANCADTAHIMVALERAAGIPARYNHGTCRFSSGHYYGHVWAQVYVNGKWYYADGTSSRNSFGVVKNWNTKNFTLHGIYASLPF